jgi:hypothetical protein
LVGQDFIDAELKAGGGVVVHCQRGVSRSASVVIAFLMRCPLRPLFCWNNMVGSNGAWIFKYSVGFVRIEPFSLRCSTERAENGATTHRSNLTEL